MSGYFFTYIGNIPEEFHSKLFSAWHILAVGLVACSWIILILLFKDRSQRAKWNFIKLMSLLLPVLELAQMIWYGSVGEFSFGYTLPLHLCSLMSVILPIMAFSGNGLLKEYSYAMGLAPALMTLITPDVYYYPAFSFIYLQTMLVHGIICLIPLFMIFAMGFRPDIRKLPKVVGLLVVLAILMVPVNYITDGNYFFLRYPAPGSPMESFATLVGSPWYLVPTFLLGCVLWAVLYLPFVLHGAVVKRRKQTAVEVGAEQEEREPALMK